MIVAEGGFGALGKLRITSGMTGEGLSFVMLEVLPIAKGQAQDISDSARASLHRQELRHPLACAPVTKFTICGPHTRKHPQVMSPVFAPKGERCHWSRARF